MDTVDFITNETGDDLIISFAIAGHRDPSAISSLTLLRTPKYEHLLPKEERGVNVSLEGRTDDVSDFVQGVALNKNERELKITTRLRSYELDLTKVDEEEILQMQKVFRKMNFDNCFRYACV